MRIVLNFNDDQLNALQILMDADLQTNRTAYFAYLIAQEAKRRTEDAAPPRPHRGPGRPRRSDEPHESDTSASDLPDEAAPKTLSIPPRLQKYVPLPDRKKKVNEYDLVMLEEKAKLSAS